MQDRGRYLALGLIAPLATVLLIPATVAETIYRCNQADGSVVFSDTPCDDRGEPYESTNRLSVIEAPQHLAERMAENQAFIDQRRQDLSRARQETVLSPLPDIQTGSSAAGNQQPWLPIGYWWPQPIEPPGPEVPGDREPRPRDDRFSALRGPFPGTTRRRENPVVEPNDQ